MKERVKGRVREVKEDNVLPAGLPHVSLLVRQLECVGVAWHASVIVPVHVGVYQHTVRLILFCTCVAFLQNLSRIGISCTLRTESPTTKTVLVLLNTWECHRVATLRIGTWSLKSCQQIRPSHRRLLRLRLFVGGRPQAMATVLVGKWSKCWKDALDGSTNILWQGTKTKTATLFLIMVSISRYLQ